MCALKVSLSTAKVKRMPGPDHHAARGRSIRMLRLMAAFAIVVALAAVVTIMKGDPADRSKALVAAAIVLGASALLGMTLVALPYAHRKKDQNDPRP